MKNILSKKCRCLLGFFAIVFAVSLIFSVGVGVFQTAEVQAKVTLQKGVWEEGTVAFDKANPQVQAVLDVQERHADVLIEEPGVIGTAIGLSKEGSLVIFVLAESFELAKEAIIPSHLEGVPVIVKITGKIEALKGPLPGREKRRRWTPLQDSIDRSRSVFQQVILTLPPVPSDAG